MEQETHIPASPQLCISLKDLAEMIREPFVVLGDDLRIVFANDEFYRRFRTTEAETKARLIYELGNGRWDSADLRVALEKLVADDAACTNLRVNLIFPEIGRRLLLVAGRRIGGGAGGKSCIVVTLEDRPEKAERAENDCRNCCELVETFNAISTDALYRRNLSTDTYDFISPAIEGITGLPADSFSLLTMEEILARIHPDDVRLVSEKLDEIMERKNFSGVFEYRFLAENGEYVWIGDNFTIVQDDENNLKYRVGVFRNINQAKQLEEKVRTSEERLRLAIEAADLGTWDLDLASGAMVRSLRHDQIWGYSEIQPEWGVKIARRRVLPEDRSIIKKAYGRAIKTGKLFFEARVRWPDGSIHWIASQGHVHFDGQDKPARIIGVVADITERKRTEEALLKVRDSFQQQVRLFRGISSTTPDHVFVFDTQGRFLYANRRLLEVWGMKLPDIIGKTPLQLGYEKWHHDMHMREIAEVIKTQKPIKGEVPFRAWRTGIFGVYEYIFTPVIGTDGEVESIAGTTRDITERKHQEEERERLIAKLEAANKELKGFTYSVSHDLRAPIRHMNSFTELLKKDSWAVLSEQSRSFLTTIIKASNTMSTLADELLQFARMGRIELEEARVDLNSVIKDAIKSLAMEQQGRDVQWQIDDLPEIWGDAAMLHLVFLNLIDNALKFTRGRSIAVIEIRVKVEEDELVFYIKDNGIGFDMQYYNKLFGIFQRLHAIEEIEGSGIGLANVARIVQRHGGRVWAEGKVGEGAAFYLSFPRERVQIHE